MRWSYNLERSYPAAFWLTAVAGLVFAMVIVGGATRLTGSGLSITEWRPVTGALPPLSAHGWAVEFQKYQRIPQYQLVNRGMSLAAFKSLYWWEWGHRLLGRIVGFAILAPLAVFLWLRVIPRRLVWRCALLLGLVALEGCVGWWMVASGLEARISVAPERLATHLSIALLIYSVAVWTAFEAFFGRARAPSDASRGLRVAAIGLPVLAYVQIILGALVAGNKAGQVDTDWPLMNGRLVPSDYAPRGDGLWDVLAHNPASVQFDHRLTAYALLAFAAVFAWICRRRSEVPAPARGLAVLVFVAVLGQAALGVATLMAAAPLSLSLIHQTGAVIVLTSALALAWRMQRA